MPITKSAKKAMRGSLRKRSFNLRRKKMLREEWKKLNKLNIAKETGKPAEEQLAKVFQSIDKAFKRGVIKKNTAARRKSRAARLLIHK